jgi:hypothetical protein
MRSPAHKPKECTRWSSGHCAPPLRTTAANLRKFGLVSGTLNCTDLPMKTGVALYAQTLSRTKRSSKLFSLDV